MTMIAKFAGTCTACRGRFAAGARIEWERGRGARHANPADCQPVAAPPAPIVVNLKPVADFLTAARDRGLKFPKARFLAPTGGELRLSLAGPTSTAPGAIQVKLDDLWIGRVNPDGAVVGRLAGEPAFIDALTKIAADPAAAAKAYGALMCRCSFCDLPLTDAGSVEVGYGPVCAKKWGLPHEPKGTPQLTRQVA